MDIFKFLMEFLRILDGDLNVCHFMAMLWLSYLAILLHYLTLLKLLQARRNQHFCDCIFKCTLHIHPCGKVDLGKVVNMLSIPN